MSAVTHTLRSLYGWEELPRLLPHNDLSLHWQKALFSCQPQLQNLMSLAHGYTRYIGYGVLAYNLHVIGRQLLAQRLAAGLEEAALKLASAA